MKAINRMLLGLLVLACFSCSDPTVKVTVELVPAVNEAIDPFASGVLNKVSIRIDGPERFDDAMADLSDGKRLAEFLSFPGERTIRIEANAYDSQGILRAFGRKDEIKIESEDVTVKIPFRRVLAYVTHASICDGRCRAEEACVNAGRGYECLPLSSQCTTCEDGESCVASLRQHLCLSNYNGPDRGPNSIYAIDANTRQVVDRIALPSAQAQAGAITAHEGESLLVPYQEAAKAYVGVLSQSDHTWKSVEFDRPIDLAMMGFNGLGVAAGSGSIEFFELSSGRVYSGMAQVLAGKVLDGVVGEGGRKAVIVMSGRPGVLLVDFETQEIYPPGEIEGASGVGLSDDGRLAYITSADSRTVKALDLRSAGLNAMSGEFLGEPGRTVFSGEISGLLSLYTDEKENIHRVIAYSVSGRRGFEAGSEVTVLPHPRGIAAIPGGRRVMVVSAGTSTESAGLTVIDPDLEAGLQGSTISYPNDTEDSYSVPSAARAYQRYRPHRLAISYGR